MFNNQKRNIGKLIKYVFIQNTKNNKKIFKQFPKTVNRTSFLEEKLLKSKTTKKSGLYDVFYGRTNVPNEHIPKDLKNVHISPGNRKGHTSGIFKKAQAVPKETKSVDCKTKVLNSCDIDQSNVRKHLAANQLCIDATTGELLEELTKEDEVNEEEEEYE